MSQYTVSYTHLDVYKRHEQIQAAYEMWQKAQAGVTIAEKSYQRINDLFYIWKREFQTTFRDQGVLIFFILVPLGYPLLYSFIYDNEVVREVPAVVVDDSHSSLQPTSLHLLFRRYSIYFREVRQE